MRIAEPQALQQVVTWRQQAAQHLGEWSHIHCEKERTNIEDLLHKGELQQALIAAQILLEQCQKAGEEAYQNADYDLALAHFNMGRVLQTTGIATQALLHLQQAQQRFEQLAEKLGEVADGMASSALSEQSECLRTLGQLEAAAVTCIAAIGRSEKLADTRQVALGKLQLSTIRKDQRRYADALQGYREALQLFQQLDEPTTLSAIWHQIGMVHHEIGDYPQAEQAYRQSLAIKSQQDGNYVRERSSLHQLGNLYKDWNRPEQAVSFYRQAIYLCVQLGDLRGENFARSNLANTLIQLGRYDEARHELQRAIECQQTFGYGVQPWKTWGILHDLEHANGNLQAAQTARQQAKQIFLAYRRGGGENHQDGAGLCLAVGQAIQQGNTSEVKQVVEQYLQIPEIEEAEFAKHKKFFHKLQAILAGERDLALAEDEELHYQYAVELVLLLEALQEAGI